MNGTLTYAEMSIAHLPPTTSSRIPLVPPSCAERFAAHVAELPTMADLVARMRSADPSFDEHLRVAEGVRHGELLAGVAAGRLSRITAERLRLGMTQEELAGRVGMAQPNISRLEKPGAPLSVATARRLAAALEISDYRDLLP